MNLPWSTRRAPSSHVVRGRHDVCRAASISRSCDLDTAIIQRRAMYGGRPFDLGDALFRSTVVTFVGQSPQRGAGAGGSSPIAGAGTNVGSFASGRTRTAHRFARPALGADRPRRQRYRRQRRDGDRMASVVTPAGVLDVTGEKATSRAALFVRQVVRSSTQCRHTVPGEGSVSGRATWAIVRSRDEPRDPDATRHHRRRRRRRTRGRTARPRARRGGRSPRRRRRRGSSRGRHPRTQGGGPALGRRDLAEHATVTRDGFRIADHQSRNGTFVDGQRVEGDPSEPRGATPLRRAARTRARTRTSTGTWEIESGQGSRGRVARDCVTLTWMRRPAVSTSLRPRLAEGRVSPV